MDYYKRFFFAVVFLFFILLLGTSGYILIEELAILDAFYMTLITISTVGFREVTELSSSGKIFTIFLIVAGVGVLLYTLTTTIEFILEGHLRGILQKRKMSKYMKKLKNHFIICGYGKVGEQVVQELKKYKNSFLVIENSIEKYDKSKNDGNMTIEGDASSESVLLEAGIERAAGLISAVDTDADNVFIVLTARGLNSKIFIVSRADSYKAIEKLKKAGANRVISPAIIGGKRMATMLVKPLVCDFLDLESEGRKLEFQLEEIEIQNNSRFINMTIRDSKLREKYGTLVLAIQKKTGELNTSPSADAIIESGDKLVIIGTRSQIDTLNKLL